MNNKEYLEQISSQTRPTKAPGALFGLSLNAKTIKILIGLAIAALVIIIIGSILSASGPKNTEQDYLSQIYLRTDNLTKSIEKYNKYVKSSELRSMGNSLSAVLTETNYNVTTYLREVLEVKSPGQPEKEKIVTDETAHAEELDKALEDGRLSGTMDRVYAREFAYEIGMLSALESEAIARTKNDTLKNELTTSSNNLGTLYDQFNNFSAQ